MPKGGGGGGVKTLPKYLDLFRGFYCLIPLKHFLSIFLIRLFKSARRKNSVQNPKTFSEAKKIRFYAVLSHLAKCCNSLIRSAPQLPKVKGGGVQAFWAMPVSKPGFLSASLRDANEAMLTLGLGKCDKDDIELWGNVY